MHTEIGGLVFYNQILEGCFTRISVLLQSIPEAQIKSDCGLILVDLVRIRAEEIYTASFWNKYRWFGHYEK